MPLVRLIAYGGSEESLSPASLAPGDSSASNVFSISGVFFLSVPPFLPFFLPPSPSLPPPPSRHVLWLEVLQDVPWLVYTFGVSPSFPLVLSRQASFNRDT